MTDNEILKALECCANEQGCENCPANPHRGNYGFCTPPLIRAAFDLITRQQAAIDEWKMAAIKNANKAEELEREKSKLLYSSLIGKTRAYAIKEFAERLKESRKQYNGTLAEWTFTMAELDNLVQEMVGDGNGTIY